MGFLGGRGTPVDEMRVGVLHAGVGREEASVMFSGHLNFRDVDAVLDF